MKHWMFLIISIIFFQCNYAFISHNADAFLQTSIQDTIHVFNEEKLKELKTTDDYNYTEKAETSNWWTEFKEWLWLQFQELFGDGLGPDSFLFKIIKLLPYIIPVIAFVLIIWVILKTNPGSQVMRQHNKSKVILTEEEEMLMQRDLNQLAEEAISNSDLRLAVRYLYLNCIKRLDMKRIIRYANEKTNYEYIKEIETHEIAQKFKSLTLSYEQIWYGQMVFDEQYFQKFKLSYNKFQSLLDQKIYAKA